MNQHSPYLSGAFEQKKLIREARKHLKHIEYDVMVGTGLSGSLVVPLLAYVLKKRFAILRKDRKNSHGELDLEGDLMAGDRWIFVDDFISSGTTSLNVKNAMNKRERESDKFPLRYVGRYLYSFANFFEHE